MRGVYSPPSQSANNLPLVFAGALMLTLAVFLVLPLTQMVSGRRSSLLSVRSADLAQLSDEPTKTEAELPPLQETDSPPEPPPSFSEATAPLNLSVNLDIAFGSGGAMAMGNSLLQQLAAQSGGLDAFDVSELEKRPEPISTVPPTYPESMRKNKIEGMVTLVFVLTETGTVEDPRVESSTHKEFEAPALDVIRKWKFRPGYKDGQPVRTYLRQPIRFRLSSSK